jgi:nucleoside-diphosphate-sugar epimerase
VYGDGRQSRDFVFVADVVAANLLALDACLSGDAGRRDEVDGAVVNVGTGVRVDLLEIVRLAEELRSGEADVAPIDFRAPREGDIRASQADISRARRLLGYEPAVGFADGLAATYAWRLEQGFSS